MSRDRTWEHLHGVSCRKKNSNIFRDGPRPLAKPRGVDKALEVLQESGNLIMENTKEGMALEEIYRKRH